MTINEAISKYRISLSTDGMLKVYFPGGKSDPEARAWLKAHKPEIVAELTRREDERKAAAQLETERHQHFMAIPGVQEIMSAMDAENEYKREYNLAWESGDGIYPARPFPPDHIDNLRAQYPDAAFAVKIYGEMSKPNMELVSIASKVYNAIADGTPIPDAREMYNTLKDEFVNRHIWD